MQDADTSINHMQTITILRIIDCFFFYSLHRPILVNNEHEHSVQQNKTTKISGSTARIAASKESLQHLLRKKSASPHGTAKKDGGIY
jgi:hypothetical protein